jgi:hypothetical protein
LASSGACRLARSHLTFLSSLRLSDSLRQQIPLVGNPLMLGPGLPTVKPAGRHIRPNKFIASIPPTAIARKTLKRDMGGARNSVVKRDVSWLQEVSSNRGLANRQNSFGGNVHHIVLGGKSMSGFAKITRQPFYPGTERSPAQLLSYASAALLAQEEDVSLARRCVATEAALPSIQSTSVPGDPRRRSASFEAVTSAPAAVDQ